MDLFNWLNQAEKISLDKKDFTITEIMEIISQTPLTEMDRQIAELRFVNNKKVKEIAEMLSIELEIVKSNLPKISLELKKTYMNRRDV